MFNLARQDLQGWENADNPRNVISAQLEEQGSQWVPRNEAQFLAGRQNFARKVEDRSLGKILKQKKLVQLNQKEANRAKRKMAETLSKGNSVPAQACGDRSWGELMTC